MHCIWKHIPEEACKGIHYWIRTTLSNISLCSLWKNYVIPPNISKRFLIFQHVNIDKRQHAVQVPSNSPLVQQLNSKKECPPTYMKQEARQLQIPAVTKFQAYYLSKYDWSRIYIMQRIYCNRKESPQNAACHNAWYSRWTLSNLWAHVLSQCFDVKRERLVQ